MISLQNIALRRGTQLLLSQASLNIYSGQKIGVIGRNGSGKTSLFKLLMGELSHDEGRLDMPEGLKKSQMRQETEGSSRPALAYVIDGDTGLRRVESAIAEAEAAARHEQLGQLHAELELMDGYSVTNRAEQLLSGLGFQTAEFQKAVQEFSGGWRIRLNLAQALMTPSDLLLLDEPTNHLDLEATLWLQQWLQRYPGTLLLISHDRSFLDKVVSHIASVDNQQLTLYRGNYSDYERQKAERLAQQQAIYQKQQQRKQEIENFVRRFRVQANKARQAQSRLKELDRMTLIAPAHVDSPFQFSFPKPDKLPDSLLACDRIDVGYKEVLIRNFSINIRADSRIGLLGANGQGKSTLLKVLANQLPVLGGETSRSDHLKVAYCAQHQIDVMDAAATPLQLLQALDKTIREQEARDFLGRFDFQGDRIMETIGHFSGGEKSRLALALVVMQRPNLLVLDEPTNHLDLEMRHALTVALQEYSGALILVSHDRYLLNNTVDQFLLVKAGRVEYFEGDLDDYEKMLLEAARSEQKNSRTGAGDGKPDRKEQRQQSAAYRNQIKPLTNRIRKLEQELDKKHQRQRELERRLADTALYEDQNKGELNGILQEQGRLGSEVDALESQWLSCNEELENF
ncbi:MAG: ATP-binding cassette domain-containing protein [Pseudomonadales bacterium]|nr:ATP-binding cassette domain-containing protein [Pseudomonadales bacterium]